MDAAQSSLGEGKLLIAYSDKNGSTIGVEFSAVASSQATFLMGACSVAATGKEKRIVTSAVIDDTEIIQTASGDGGTTWIRGLHFLNLMLLASKVTSLTSKPTIRSYLQIQQT